MKNYLYSVFVLSLLICGCAKHAKNETNAAPGTVIIREKYSTGGIKAEITTIGDLRQGLTTNYDRQGRVLSKVNYIDNMKEGIATNYYAATGKVYSTLVYKHDIKEGDETWYYESGKPYRITPYIQGKIEGTQKLLFENGDIKAEVPYKNGFPGTGLKEYKKDRTLFNEYPKIVIKREDHLKDANKIVLIITLSNNSQIVKFYEGSLLEGKYIHDGLLLLATQKGSTQIDYNLAPGSRLKQKVQVAANYKTQMGNPLVISKSYNLEAFNP